MNSYGINEHGYFERIIWVYQYCNFSIDEIKRLIIECFNEISFDDPFILQTQKRNYFNYRRINSEFPPAEDFIKAYETTLIAQGLKNKTERKKLIKETLKASASRAAKNNYFARKGVGKSEIQRVFTMMQFNPNSYFVKD